MRINLRRRPRLRCRARGASGHRRILELGFNPAIIASKLLGLEQNVRGRIAESLLEPAPETALLHPVVKQNTADDRHADDEQTQLKVAHRAALWMPEICRAPVRRTPDHWV